MPSGNANNQTTQDLGLVAAMRDGPSPPSNTKLLWYNTIDGFHYRYDITLMQWVTIYGSGSGGSVSRDIHVSLRNGKTWGTIKDGDFVAAGTPYQDLFETALIEGKFAPTKLSKTTLSATGDSPSTIKLNWLGINNNSGYLVQRANNAQFTVGLTTIYNGNGLSYDDYNLLANTIYYYRITVIGHDQYANSDYAYAQASTKTQVIVVTPTPPTVTVSVTPLSGLYQYKADAQDADGIRSIYIRIYRAGDDSLYASYGPSAVGQTSFTSINGVPPTGSYYAIATATDTANTSGNSNKTMFAIAPVVVTPAPPTINANDANDTLIFGSPLGISEIVVSTQDGPFLPYTNSISIGDVDRPEGYYKAKIKGGTNRNESVVVRSPAFTVKPVVIVITTPDAPGMNSNDGNDTLSFSSPLGDSEILVSIGNAAYVAYTGTYYLGDADFPYGYYKAKIRSASGRNESATTYSPAFTKVPAPPAEVVYDNTVYGGDSLKGVTLGAMPGDKLEFNNASGANNSPVEMSLYRNGEQVASVPFDAYYSGKACRYTLSATGQRFTITFKAGQVDL
jgi:hypothetical protein